MPNAPIKECMDRISYDTIFDYFFQKMYHLGKLQKSSPSSVLSFCWGDKMLITNSNYAFFGIIKGIGHIL